jgi:arylsulfatase A-like enzyme
MRKKIPLLFVLLVAVPTFCFCQQNVILIIADDLGTDYCGFYEDAKDTAKMPNIRSLLGKGVRFQNAWASPVCSPTRSGIATGRYPFRTGVGTVVTGAASADLDTAEVTIARLLKYNAPVSYATANIGKWHLNQQTNQKLFYPNQYFGYDLYSGSFLGELSDYYKWFKVTNGVGDTVNTYATTENVNDAINWLDTIAANKPFFLWLAFNAPHTPFHIPPDSLHTITGLTGTTQHINQNPELYFKAMIEAMDKETGRLFQWLTANNKMDSTNLIFIGDNGTARRVAQIADTSHTKGTLYEYGVHVPFIISGPSVVNPGRTSDALINTPDLFATITEMAGYTNWQNAIPPNVTVDSKSLMPIVKNELSAVHDWVFTEQFNPVSDPKDGKAIRNKAYKLLVFDDGHQEFYNLGLDGLEESNLLLQTLSDSDIINYNYLCNQLAMLVGSSHCLTLTGVNEVVRQDIITLSPNPATNQLIINSSVTIQQINIYNTTGQLVKTVYDSSQVDISNLAKGVYMAEIKTKQANVMRRWVKM